MVEHIYKLHNMNRLSEIVGPVFFVVFIEVMLLIFLRGRPIISFVASIAWIAIVLIKRKWDLEYKYKFSKLYLYVSNRKEAFKVSMNDVRVTFPKKVPSFLEKFEISKTECFLHYQDPRGTWKAESIQVMNEGEIERLYNYINIHPDRRTLTEEENPFIRR